jgi:hypothetical protein
MSTMKKTLMIAVIAMAVGAEVYVARLAAGLQNRIRTLQQQRPPPQQMEQLRRQLANTNNRLAAAQRESEALQREQAELSALPVDLIRLQKDSQELARLKADAAAMETTVEDWRLPILDQLNQALAQMPETKIPELQLLTNLEWLGIAQFDQLRMDTQDQVRESLCTLRSTAKNRFVRMMWEAVDGYTKATGGQLPADLSQLQPYFSSPVDDSILQRYQILQTGNLKDVSADQPWVAEKAPVDEDHDLLFQVWVKSRIAYQRFNAAERERQALMKLVR